MNNRRYQRPCTWLLRGAVATCTLLASIVPAAHGQSGPEANYRPYELQHVRAADAELRLKEMLGPGAVEVVVDAESNRLLVMAAPQAQETVRQVLHSLDQPAAVAAVPTTQQPAANPAVLKPYPVDPAKLNEAAAWLQERYKMHPEVRVATDARASQVLVMAPAVVHTQIAPLFPSPTVPRHVAQQSQVSQVNYQTAATSQNVVVPLRNTHPEIFENSLRSVAGSRAPAPSAARGGELAIYTLPSGGDSPVTLTIDRRSASVAISGPSEAATAWSRVVGALDTPKTAGAHDTQVLKIENAEKKSVRKVLAAFQSEGPDDPRAQLTTALLQPGADGDAAVAQQPAAQQPEAQQPAQGGAVQGAVQGGTTASPEAITQAAEAAAASGLIGSVQIEFLEGLDIIVIRGNKRDVERVAAIINDIEQRSLETLPTIEIYELEHVNSEALAALIQQVYDQSLAPRQSGVSITPLVKPNALLLIGREESVKTVIDLIDRLDQPVEPSSQFQVFFLKYAAAGTVQSSIQEFFGAGTGGNNQQPAGLGTRVLATADGRTNSVIVRASPRDLLEVQALIRRLDVSTSAAENVLKIIPLQNSLADELAALLTNAIAGQSGGGQDRPITQGPPAPGAAALAAQTQSTGKSSMLRFMMIDAQGQRQITSGILTDVSITSDPRANTLIVSAPAESMELIEALIRQLDQVPTVESQIKVFTIVNGDATMLAQMLGTMFGVTTTGIGGQAGGLAAFQQLQQGTEPSLIPLKLAVDTRTNSIIASGPLSTLNVIEAILLRLDADDVRDRRTTVYRLRNSPALYVANSMQQLLLQQRQLLGVQGLVSAFDQLQREVLVVPEEITNSLIISASPRYYDEVQRIIEELDARPLMVTIQVLIAEVVLENTDEFGIELGLQDSILFDRSVVGTGAAAGTNIPGYNFNNQPLGNGNSPQALAQSGTTAWQGLSNFAVGRTNPELGFGGLVIAASSESVSFLLRALNQSRRLEVLSRPQITTLDNQLAYIRVGQRVPRITDVQQTQFGTVNSTELEDVGLILRVQPRINPDGQVVMTLDTERSELAPLVDGIPISVTPTGEVLRSPIINATTAQTTVSASDGQTIVVGGLITKSKATLHRRIPLISDIPVVGNLFRYDSADQRRTELLIIMTPRIVRSETEAEIIKQVESSRMSWCLSDVVKLHGPAGLRGRSDEWTDAEVPTIFPDSDPLGVDPMGFGMGMHEMHGDEMIIHEEILTPVEQQPTPASPDGPVFDSQQRQPVEPLPVPPEQQFLPQSKKTPAAPTRAQATPPPQVPKQTEQGPLLSSSSKSTTKPPVAPTIVGGTGGNGETEVHVSFEPPPGYLERRQQQQPATMPAVRLVQ